MNKILAICLILIFSNNIFGGIKNTDNDKKVFDEAFILLKNEKYKEAYTKLLVLAKSGNGGAMLAVGNLHYQGKGVQQNYKEAFKWYKKSLHEGNTQVKYALANMYKDGIGTKKAYYKAFDLYLQSAVQTNNPKAMFFVSAMYYHGNGVGQDFDKAFKWSSKAVKQKEPRAAFLLSLLYLNAKGVKKDLEKAFYYANMSKSLGNKKAPELIAIIQKENLTKLKK